MQLFVLSYPSIEQVPLNRKPGHRAYETEMKQQKDFTPFIITVNELDISIIRSLCA